MAYKTVEADKDGKMYVYPSLYERKDKGIWRFFKGLLKRFSFPRRK
jgi:hypothetical protein